MKNNLDNTIVLFRQYNTLEHKDDKRSK